MKKCLLMTGMFTCLLVFITGTAYAQTMSLDDAINSVGDEFSYNLKKGSKVAVLSMRSGSARMSNYIIEELTSILVNQRLVTVVDRAQLDLIQQEMDLQLSGEVSDSSAQAIGKKLGAQSIVTGSFEPIGNYYRFRVRVIEVETTAIMFTHSVNVQNDHIVASLMGQTNNTAPLVITPPAYQDFTTGQRWGTWALNAFTIPGLGSYVIMKDTAGGTIQLITGGIGTALLWGGYFSFLDAVLTPENYDDTEYVDEQRVMSGIVIMALGGLTLAANHVYNIIRSVTYNKPRPKTASLIDPAAWNIVILPGRNGIEQVRLSYTIRF
jgi:TolB-like protein